MPRAVNQYSLIVIGGGHAGAEAAWAGASMLRQQGSSGRVALLTLDPEKIGVMSCNPAIGGLAKGQIVREIDAMGGLMALAADATGIQFRVLNQSKGPAVRGPRSQNDKYAYAREVQRLLGTAGNLDIIAGRVEQLLVEDDQVTGLVYMPSARYADAPWREHLEGQSWGDNCCSGEHFTGPNGSDPIIAPTRLNARAIILTTGTFMRGLMHTGESKTPGGRTGEDSANQISGALKNLGFELGRLKTGTPPRLDAESLDLDSLEIQAGDAQPTPFSDMTGYAAGAEADEHLPGPPPQYEKIARRFPVLEQRPCWITRTTSAMHELIRANLHRAPMYNGQIDTTGPRYCPSIEDKIVRFPDRQQHHVFLEPESLRTGEIYCNGISTSLPTDVQEKLVRMMPGCSNATILRHGYAVEYDMVLPHQIDATCMTKRVAGLFLAGQINGTTGYEEAAGQGILAGINAILYLRDEQMLRLRRDQAYIGVLMDDLVTKTPREPYRMFTSRAEHRLLLRADNVDQRLTPLARELGLVDDVRWRQYQQRAHALKELRYVFAHRKVDGQTMKQWALRPQVDIDAVLAEFDKLPEGAVPESAKLGRLVGRLLADIQYAGYIHQQQRAVKRLAQQEHQPLPNDLDYTRMVGLRTEAAHTLNHFRPATVGQARRLAGVNPADLMIVSLALSRTR